LTSTNLIGSIQVVRAALPRLRAQGGGRIIQLSTYGGQAAFPGGSLYHASKWGIEGFIEAVGQEVAPFNIGCTLVEPGGARTEFRFGGAKLGPKMYAYADTPAGMTRAMLQDTSRLPIGDPAKMVKALILTIRIFIAGNTTSGKPTASQKPRMRCLPSRSTNAVRRMAFARFRRIRAES